MKICFIAGADVHSYRWIKYFAERGHEIHWISLAPNRHGEMKNVKFYFGRQFSRKWLDVLFNISMVKKTVRKISPDILHTHYAGVNGVLGALT